MGRTAIERADAALCVIESDFGQSGRDVRLEAIRCEIEEAAYAERMNCMTIIRTLYAELEEIVKNECCDHSVGICWCSTFRALDEASAFLVKLGFGK